MSSRVTGTVAFTSGTLPVWARDFADIMKDEVHIRKLRFDGGVVYQAEYFMRSQAVARERELKGKKSRSCTDQLVRASRL